MILKYFPTFVGDVPLDQRSEAQFRYDRAMRFDLVGILASALVADHCWIYRVTLLPNKTFELLRQESSEGFMDMISTGGSENGRFPLHELIRRLNAAQSAQLT